MTGQRIGGEEAQQYQIMKEERSATRIELTSASIMRASAKTAAYHFSDGPLKGGTGTREPWKENSTRTATGRKMKP